MVIWWLFGKATNKKLENLKEKEHALTDLIADDILLSVHLRRNEATEVEAIDRDLRIKSILLTAGYSKKTISRALKDNYIKVVEKVILERKDSDDEWFRKAAKFIYIMFRDRFDDNI